MYVTYNTTMIVNASHFAIIFHICAQIKYILINRITRDNYRKSVTEAARTRSISRNDGWTLIGVESTVARRWAGLMLIYTRLADLSAIDGTFTVLQIRPIYLLQTNVT